MLSHLFHALSTSASAYFLIALLSYFAVSGRTERKDESEGSDWSFFSPQSFDYSLSLSDIKGEGIYPNIGAHSQGGNLRSTGVGLLSLKLLVKLPLT